MVVDGAEHLVGMVGVYESAGPIINRLAGDGRVVGVKHPVDETDEHPAGDKLGERRNNRVEEGDCGVIRPSKVRIVAINRVVGEDTKRFQVLAYGKY